MKPDLHILKDEPTLFRRTAGRLSGLIRETIEQRGACHLALTGGSTPRGLYQELAAAWRESLDWSKVHIWFSDERCVPPDHPESNYGMARESLLNHLPIPAEQVHRMEGERDPAQAAAVYNDLLERAFPREEDAGLDICLLGLGPDGHVASLFPESDTLAEERLLATAAWVEKLAAWRITLTLPVLDHARHTLVLVSGEKKADIVRHVMHADIHPDAAPLPIQMIRPRGSFEWWMDAEAALYLNREPEA